MAVIDDFWDVGHVRVHVSALISDHLLISGHLGAGGIECVQLTVLTRQYRRLPTCGRKLLRLRVLNLIEQTVVTFPIYPCRWLLRVHCHDVVL